LKNCHPERSEGSAVSSDEDSAAPSPETPSPESPTERRMNEWAQRVHSLYHRKR
jgi:hypothetical protein